MVGDSGQVTPSRSSDVDSCNDSGWDSDDEDTPSKELEVHLHNYVLYIHAPTAALLFQNYFSKYQATSLHSTHNNVCTMCTIALCERYYNLDCFF